MVLNTAVSPPPAAATIAPAASRRGRSRGHAPGEPRRIAYLYLAPALLMVVVFVLLPVLHTVYLSLVQWDGVTAATFVGLGNYVDILTDPQLRALFLHSLELVFFFAALPIGLGL